MKNLKDQMNRLIPGILFACVLSFLLEGGIKDYFSIGVPWADEISDQHIESGKTLFAAGYLEEALRYFERAAKADPNDAKAFAHRGAVYAAKEDFREALVFYEKAFRLSPNNCEILSSLGYNYFKSGDAKKTIEYITKKISNYALTM